MTTKDIIDEVLSELKKLKNKMLSEEAEQFKKREPLTPISTEELEQIEQSQVKIKTGTLIDEIIGGGIAGGESMMVYGEYACGKTQTCLTMTVLCPDWVIYIDTENSLRMSRIKEICEARNIDYETVKKKLIVYRPENWIDQIRVLYSLPSPIDLEGKVGLIILDSLNKHFRGVEFAGRENLQIKTTLMGDFLTSLKKIAISHGAALVYTAQIFEVPAATPYTSKVDLQKPLGGHKITHEPTISLFIRKASGNIRIATVVDNSFKPLAERPFVINEKGIDILPEEAKAYKRYERRAKEFEKKQQQEKLKAGKKSENN